jgi:hypothetical protein
MFFAKSPICTKSGPKIALQLAWVLLNLNLLWLFDRLQTQIEKKEWCNVYKQRNHNEHRKQPRSQVKVQKMKLYTAEISEELAKTEVQLNVASQE